MQDFFLAFGTFRVKFLSSKGSPCSIPLYIQHYDNFAKHPTQNNEIRFVLSSSLVHISRIWKQDKYMKCVSFTLPCKTHRISWINMFLQESIRQIAEASVDSSSWSTLSYSPNYVWFQYLLLCQRVAKVIQSPKCISHLSCNHQKGNCSHEDYMYGIWRY